MPSFDKAQLVLPVSDLKAARDWYEQTLGFETVYLHTDPEDDPTGNYAILKRDTAELHLILDEPPREHPWTTAGTGYVFLVVAGVESIHDKVVSNGVSLTRGLQEESWGARSFQLTDPSGNLILVAEVNDSV